MHIKAARIVSGVTRSISLKYYTLTVGLHLMTEELTKIIVLTVKIKNNMVPDYLSDLFPSSVSNPR